MILMFQQIEGESTPDAFGKVPDDVMGRILTFWANKELQKKYGTMAQLLGALSDADMVPYRERLREYWTKRGHHTPKDILIMDCNFYRLYGGFNFRWDFTEEWKARKQKKYDRELHESVAAWEKQQREKAKK